jgi:hypothetical protein
MFNVNGLSPGIYSQPQVALGANLFVRVIQMHFLRLFLMAWLPLGIVSVFFLFVLCKRTAATVKEPGRVNPFSPQSTDKQVGEIHAA